MTFNETIVQCVDFSALRKHRNFVRMTREANEKGNIPNVVDNLERFLSRADGRGLPARGHDAAMDRARRSFVRFSYNALAADGSVLMTVQTITLECARAVAESDKGNAGIVAGWISTIAGEPIERWEREKENG